MKQTAPTMARELPPIEATGRASESGIGIKNPTKAKSAKPGNTRRMLKSFNMHMVPPFGVWRKSMNRFGRKSIIMG